MLFESLMSQCSFPVRSEMLDRFQILGTSFMPERVNVAFYRINETALTECDRAVGFAVQMKQMILNWQVTGRAVPGIPSRAAELDRPKWNFPHYEVADSNGCPYRSNQGNSNFCVPLMV